MGIAFQDPVRHRYKNLPLKANSNPVHSGSLQPAEQSLLGVSRMGVPQGLGWFPHGTNPPAATRGAGDVGWGQQWGWDFVLWTKGRAPGGGRPFPGTGDLPGIAAHLRL